MGVGNFFLSMEFLLGLHCHFISTNYKHISWTESNKWPGLDADGFLESSWNPVKNLVRVIDIEDLVKDSRNSWLIPNQIST
jgi:hypothetical protein